MVIMARLVISKAKRGDAELSKEEINRLREKFESDD
jgi:hypothetical protein